VIGDSEHPEHDDGPSECRQGAVGLLGRVMQWTTDGDVAISGEQNDHQVIQHSSVTVAVDAIDANGNNSNQKMYGRPRRMHSCRQQVRPPD